MLVSKGKAGREALLFVKGRPGADGSRRRIVGESGEFDGALDLLTGYSREMHADQYFKKI